MTDDDFMDFARVKGTGHRQATGRSWKWLWSTRKILNCAASSCSSATSADRVYVVLLDAVGDVCVVIVVVSRRDGRVMWALVGKLFHRVDCQQHLRQHRRPRHLPGRLLMSVGNAPSSNLECEKGLCADLGSCRA